MKRDELRALMARAGIRPRRTAGQNFLVEENLADAIARDGGIEPGDVTLEIGTGFGILTSRLAARAHHVVGVELDPRVAAVARELLADAENLTLLEADALASKNALAPEMVELVRARLAAAPGRLRVVANLPYNVATPLVVLLLGERWPLASITVMVQLEAAERFAAQPGDEAYGAVSVLCRAQTESVEVVRKVPRDVFMPRPKVTSAVVRLIPSEGRHQGLAELAAVTRALFNYRRKTLSKAAKAVARRHPELDWIGGAIGEAALDPGLRVEDLGVQELRSLAEIGAKKRN